MYLLITYAPSSGEGHLLEWILSKSSGGILWVIVFWKIVLSRVNGCRPSCRWCGHQPSCRCFLAGFRNLTMQGRCYRNFELTHYVPFFRRKGRKEQRRAWPSSSPLQVCLHRDTLPLHRSTTAPLAWLHCHPRWNPSLRIMLVHHVTQLGVSHSKEILFEICIYLHIYNCICFGLSTFLWIARGCVDGVSFHGLLQSEAEFWHHLRVVLWIHNLPVGTCIWRTAGR
jgi:hypothetical protein